MDLVLSKVSEEQLLEKIRQGETQYFEELIRRNNRKLYRIARGMGIPDADCDDLIQTTYIASYQKLSQFNGTAAFSTWLVRILLNHCLMYKRKTKLFVSEDGLQLEGEQPSSMISSMREETDTPESQMIKNEMKKLLESAIASLPEEYKIVYMMREVEAMSVKEVSECLSLSEANVKVRLFRARKLLQTQLQKYLEPFEIYEFGAARCDRVVQRVLSHI